MLYISSSSRHVHSTDSFDSLSLFLSPIAIVKSSRRHTVPTQSWQMRVFAGWPTLVHSCVGVRVWVWPYFPSNDQHVLLAFHGWFVRWEVYKCKWLNNYYFVGYCFRDLFKTSGATIQLFKTSGATIQLFKTSGATIQLFKTSGATRQLFKTSGATIQLFKTSGATIQLFKTSGATRQLFKTSSATIQLFKTSGATRQLFKTSGATRQLFKTSGATIQLFKTSGATIQLFKTSGATRQLYWHSYRLEEFPFCFINISWRGGFCG